MLGAAKGEVVSKDELMAAVWPHAVVEENALHVHVSALRKALGDANNDNIVTVPGRGYNRAAERNDCFGRLSALMGGHDDGVLAHVEP